ncbi:hypothetical protein G7K_6280-t1 [Saitoella complicata NRRL Y-17804]|uniref:Uncharacterized protein n=1 Tax=Saitoella complicata (strain BCRC 22490 / CBS 7301 / JCM 7358 / NBRC 10748 / NRRL Y-17804) TaxID=698492 RepID=A0A0E9NQP1_SAICN|nr:hypothetical protein G7K_6280-t1 [Saitoella complicata NRRL Y-17804]
MVVVQPDDALLNLRRRRRGQTDQLPHFRPRASSVTTSTYDRTRIATTQLSVYSQALGDTFLRPPEPSVQ